MTTKRPRTGSELPIGSKIRGVMHRLVSGAAHKPEAIVRIPKSNDALRESHPEMFTGDAGVATRPVIAKMTRLSINATAPKWLKAVEQIARSQKVKVSDLWVLIHCSGIDRPVLFSTRIRNDIIGFQNQECGDGKIKAFVRLEDLIQALVERQAPQLAIQGNQFSYAGGGLRYDLPYSERMANEVVSPVPPPESGYEELRGLGSAITEAQRFAKPEIDHMTLHAVQVIPLRDGTGNCEVVALSTSMAYRRITHQPAIKDKLTILPNWLFTQPRLVGATLGMRMAGADFVWFVTSKGLIAGLSMETDLPYPSNYRECFEASDGRVDFTVDEIRALRRALGQVGQIGEQREVGLSSNGREFTIRGQETVSVTCQGDPMNEILADPQLLGEALKVRGVISLEFSKEDPNHVIRLVGRDIAIAVMPCEQEEPARE